MSAIIDLLAVTQEQVVMQVLAEKMAIDISVIDPKYFTFVYNQLDDNRVAVQCRARVQTVDGEKSPWQGDHTLQFYRAQLRGTSTARSLTVNWVPGMAMEHVLRALRLTNSFNVSIAELEFLQADGTWVVLTETYRPAQGTLTARFVKGQARFVPSTSQFTIVLAQTIRNDLDEYLRLISAGTVTGDLA